MSKKALFALILVGALVGQVAFAATQPPTSCKVRGDVQDILSECPGKGETCYYETDAGAGTSASDAPCGLCCLLGTVVYFTDILFMLLIIASVIFVFLGAFFIISAGGNADKINKGRNYILYAIIGFGAALLANAIPNILGFFLGSTT